MTQICTVKPGKYLIPNGYVALYQVRPGIENKPIIPRKVQECIFDAVRSIKKNTTFEKDNKIEILLHDKPHGPAVNVILHPQDWHEINIDLTASIRLPSTVKTFKSYKWPRAETEAIKNFDFSLIDSVAKSPVQLVPKADKFWKISTGVAEKVLLQRKFFNVERCGEGLVAHLPKKDPS